MVIGVVLSIPIIFFGSQLVTGLMRKYAIVVYIGGGILANTAFDMLLEDRFYILHYRRVSLTAGYSHGTI